MATGQRINRPSDDAIGASAISALEESIERRAQRTRNLSHAEGVLNTADQSLGDATEILNEARSIGLSQIGVGSDAATRESQSVVIDAMLKEMVNIANREYQDIHLFGGNRTAVQPFEFVGNGLVYRGRGEGMTTDIAAQNPLPITISGEQAFGALSTRKEGEIDLDPRMTLDTRLSDLFGATNEGVRREVVRVDINGSDYELDLTNAETIGDVTDAIEDVLNIEAPGALGPNGVTVDAATGNRLNIDLNGGFSVTFSDPGSEGTAGDLGLAGVTFADGTSELGTDINPMLTDLTTLDNLAGITTAAGELQLSNNGEARTLTLDGNMTVQELKNTVAAMEIGIRVEIAETGDRLNFVNELSGSQMSIGEVNGSDTATLYGLRTFSLNTPLDEFNAGRGIQILSGSVDPVTGNPDPARDTDFQIELKDGRTFEVDIAGAEVVGDVITAINDAATNAGITVPGDFAVALAIDGNGFEFTDNTTGITTVISAINGSFAAQDLGILTSSDSATFTGEDRATVAVESVFSHLIALRDALKLNDERGIQLATDRLEGDIDLVTQARAEVGVRAQRVSRLASREESLQIQDVALKSSIQDLDFTEASIRFANLQTQLQATLSTTAQSLSLSLIDFLR